MTASEYYQKGELREAVAAALDDVKRHPTDNAKRGFLAELLCFTGDLERADRQLAAVDKEDPDALMDVIQFRQLICAEQARQKFYTEGRPPEFVNQEITPDLHLRLQAAALLRDQKSAEAAALLTQAHEQRPKIAGSCDGKPFEDFCDLDDLTSSFFEVLTRTGAYFWIPIARVESIEFGPRARLRDLLWRQARFVVRGGPDSEVFLPVLYAGSPASTNDQIRLGRATDWQGGENAPVCGVGQRVFLVGDEDRPILDLKTITFDS